MSCRKLIRAYRNIESNYFGFALANTVVRDLGQGFRGGFVFCHSCKSKFVATWPNGRKTVACVFCENERVWTK